MEKKKVCVLLSMIMTLVSLSGCGGSYGGMENAAPPMVQEDFYTYSVSAAEEMEPHDWNTEEYSALEDMGFQSVANAPLSTFSADVDTASYSNIRRMIESGYSMDTIPDGAVRIEEMLNYFSYDYQLPKQNEPFGVTTVIGDCPWNEDAKLLQIGLKTQEIDFSEAPDSNLVFLLDVSGSMRADNKLPLLQESFSMLVEELGEKDTVSIVTYAGSTQVILQGERGDNKADIIEAINALEARGSTNGAGGIEAAYALAEQYFIEGGNNRVILATDGDLNVGASSESALRRLITQKKKSGVYLSVLGFGTGNIKDNKMETLADCGNGNYAYIDSIGEAKKVLVEQMGATLVTVAKDVKLQVEFNPAYVKGYRMIGYENRILATEDFDDDRKDAGEIGAGHMVTALYEIIPVDSRQEIPETVLKYQDNKNDTGVRNGEWLNLKIRYKEPDADESLLREYPVTEEDYTGGPSEDFYFAAAVAEFGLMLRDSEYKGTASFENVLDLLKKVDTDADEYKDEFVYLVKKLQKATL
ncbi:MAG: VWA domain-containing protein [Lachnospiraceae bacterium]|nr:VWA domain-containing protein [Lachnospiraceae bacterium]